MVAEAELIATISASNERKQTGAAHPRRLNGDTEHVERRPAELGGFPTPAELGGFRPPLKSLGPQREACEAYILSQRRVPCRAAGKHCRAGDDRLDLHPRLPLTMTPSQRYFVI